MKLKKKYSNLLSYGAGIVFSIIACSIYLFSLQEAKQLEMRMHEELSALARDLTSDEYATSEIRDAKDEIQNLTHNIVRKINALLDSESKISVADAKKEAMEILENSGYITDYDTEEGYFFVYDFEGTNIFHPIKKDWIGQNKWNYQDKYGKYVIQSLIKTALANGKSGGFETYIFHLPSGDRDIGDSGKLKLSYVTVIENFNWIIGTGVYLSTVDRFLNHIDQAINLVHNNLASTYWIIIPLVLGFIFILYFSINSARSGTYEDITVKLHTNVKQDLGYLVYQYDKLLLGKNQITSEIIGVNRSVLSEQSEIIHKTFDKFTAILEDRDPEHINLIEGINNYKNKFEEKYGISIAFKASDEIIELSKELSIAKTTAIQDITYETLWNTIKHADASEIEILLSGNQCNIILIVKDNGRGFNCSRYGVCEEIHKYAQKVGGEVEIISSTIGVNGSLEIFTSDKSNAIKSNQLMSTRIFITHPHTGTAVIAKIPTKHTIWSYITCLHQK